MTTGAVARRHRVLALSLACALGSPLPAAAQSQTTAAREQQLEQRVAQLEQQLAELKQMIRDQKSSQAAPAVAAAPGTPTTTTGAAPATASATTPAATASPSFVSAPGVTTSIHGLLNVTAFHQDKSFTFGNGQNAEYPVPGSRGSLTGVDVRNTRFWLDFDGPRLNDSWTGGGRLELDFFGGFNGTGGFSEQQEIARLRQVYVVLKNAELGAKVQIGQQWDLMFPLDNTPDSLAHIAFPLGFSAGVIGWRQPGVIWMQNLNQAGGGGPQWRLDLAAFNGHWNGPGNNVNYLTAGNAGFRPQLEARLHVEDQQWLGYLVGHYSQVDLRGVGGTAPTPIKDKINSTAVEVGGAWKPGNWVLRGQLYSGNGLGQLFGAMAQFGDIAEKGGFVQVGYKFTPHWSANAIYTMGDPNDRDVIRWLGFGSTGLLKNRQSAVNLLYTAGAYAFGMELMHANLESTSNGVDRTHTSGNQLSLSALYKF